MRSTTAVLGAILTMALAASVPRVGAQTPAYADLGSKPYEYTGPGRNGDDPEQVETVRIGVFLPATGHRAAQGLSLRRGAQLAVAEANRAGGAGGTPFELVVRTEASPWGSAREVVRLAYEDRVWAIAGAVGGESSHVVQQIVTKARLPLVGVATTDASLTQVNVPWTFRLLPDDDAIAECLADHLIRERQLRAIVAVASTGYDARLRAEAFETSCSRLGTPLALSLRFHPGDTDFSKQLSLIDSAGADAVVIWADPAEGAALVSAIRRLPSPPDIFAGPGLHDVEFLRLAGSEAEGITVAAVADLGQSREPLVEFRRRFSAAFSERPDAVAAAAYDGMWLVISAIRRAGLNRIRIRDAIAATETFEGVTGTIRFDGSGAAAIPVRLLVIRDGEFRPFSG